MSNLLAAARLHMTNLVRTCEECARDEDNSRHLYALFGALDALVAIGLFSREEMLYWQQDAYEAMGRPASAELTRRLIGLRADPRARSGRDLPAESLGAG